MLRRMVSEQEGLGSTGGDVDGRRRGGGGVLFAVPRLFVGFAAKQRAADESERSPTSPLDQLRSPRSPRRTWDTTEPVGLGLVDALAAGDDTTSSCLLLVRLKGCGGGGHSQPELGKTTMSCPASAGMSVPTCSRFSRGDLKNSGPDATLLNDAAHRHSFDLGNFPVSIAGGRFIGSVSASEVEQSEDYTCIIARGANPKTTHIFGDCILEPQTTGKTAMEGAAKSYLVVKCAADEDFLSSCFTCKKELEGNDIYIYRGEKAFCSTECRDQEILIEEEAENNTCSLRSSVSSLHEDIFMAGMTVAT